jgi:hypothetical protein
VFVVFARFIGGLAVNFSEVGEFFLELAYRGLVPVQASCCHQRDSQILDWMS